MLLSRFDPPMVGQVAATKVARWPPGLHKAASGASAASGQTQIPWTNVDQNHVYFFQALHRKCGKKYLTQTKGVLDSIIST